MHEGHEHGSMSQDMVRKHYRMLGINLIVNLVIMYLLMFSMIWSFSDLFHNVDFAKRTSFNHPLIITVGFAMAWLAVTGFWLLFRTMWRHDFAFARRSAGRRDYYPR
jgi:hypothetical protein